MPKARNRPKGTLFNTNVKLNPLGREFAQLATATRSAMFRYEAKDAFKRAAKAAKDPSPQEKWFAEKWPFSATDKKYFVTDGDYDLVRNNAKNYVLVWDTVEQDRLNHLRFKRRFNVIKLTPFDEASLKKALDLIESLP